MQKYLLCFLGLFLSTISHAKNPMVNLMFSGYVYEDTCTLNSQTQLVEQNQPTTTGMIKCRHDNQKILVSTLDSNNLKQYQTYDNFISQYAKNHALVNGLKVRYHIFYD